MFPVAWALMKNKKEETYGSIIKEFSNQVPEIKPKKIIGDFEIAMRNGAKTVYKADFHGCNSHYIRVSFVMSFGTFLFNLNNEIQ